MELKPELLHGIYAYGYACVTSRADCPLMCRRRFECPSAIQQWAIVPIIKGHDVITQVPSGTGITASFSIPILQRLDMSVKGTQALILAPSHELAQHIQGVVIALGIHMNVECHACVGEANAREDIAKLQEGSHVVVGTPDPVFHLINQRALCTDAIKILCLDQADDMLSRGFKDQIYAVFQLLQRGTQVVIFKMCP